MSEELVNDFWELLDLREFYFTGVQVAYYILCKRKFWLFSHGLSYEHESERVLLGRILINNYYTSEAYKESELDLPIKIDFFRIRDEIVVHEVKYSKPTNDLAKLSHELQLKYYIWFLSHVLNMRARKGVLHYPRAKRTVEVLFTDEDVLLISDAMANMKELIRSPSPPPVERKSFCKSCAYYNFCFI